MAAPSGIAVSDALVAELAGLDGSSTRFLKIAIESEQLVPAGAESTRGALADDLSILETFLEDAVPAYVLVRLDDGAGWLLVDYVPDGARVRDKMLYASTRGALTRALPAPPSDTLYATSKADLTPTAYAAHRAHLSAPKPLSAREKEMEEVKAAERAAGSTNARGSPGAFGGSGVGLRWEAALEEAVRSLGEETTERVVVGSIDASSETLVLRNTADVDADALASALPPADPCFAFFYYAALSRVAFIYACPFSSPVKHRMLYSAGAASVFSAAKDLLPPGRLAARKLETSEPGELGAAFLKAELGEEKGGSGSGAGTPTGGGGFARPKGPPRRAR